VQQLTQAGSDAVRNLAQRYGVSSDAVTTLLFAVSNGGGSMAQFYHHELGGGGQWMRGGMTMVGDMFNHGLQALVANLCSELSNLLSSQQVFVPVPQYSPGAFGGGSNNWWPGDLGSPSSSGGQNDSRYAYFPSTQRLAIDRAGHVTVYDALDHQIGGVQQQQGGSSGTLSFTSQFGTFTVDSLPTVSSNREPAQSQPIQNQPIQNQPIQNQPFQNQPLPVQNQPFQNQPAQNFGNPQSHDEILQTLERLSDLHQRGVLSEDEFRSKKSDLLSRL
jgi:Short C-terminal domain